MAEPPAKAGELDTSALTCLLGFHVRMAQVAMYRDFAVGLKDIDITQKQFAVLLLLGSNPGSAQIELGATLGTDRATMMAIVDRLQERHYLFRTPSKVDRRRQELYLTNDGRAVLEEANRRIALHEERFTKAFTPAEVEQLIGLLQRIHVAPGEG